MRINLRTPAGAPQAQGLPASLLLTAKLAFPAVRAPLVPRPRLTDRLKLQAAQPFLLAVAPAGWGKTSLIRAWVAQQAAEDHAFAWISLDPGDNDPTRFLLYLTAALDRAHPGLGDEAACLLLSPQPAPPEVVLTLLLNAISALERPLTLVLDDYHLIEAAPVHAALAFLIEHLPPTLHLALASRTDPPLPLSRLRARGQLLEIRADDLRFTPVEAETFLNRVMGLRLDADSAARLAAKTEGWIAGLQLAALSLQGQEDPTEFVASFTGSHRYIVDYLFEEVLARQSADVQRFLMETSILNRLCGPLCDALQGHSGGQAMLERLEANNLFLAALDEERRWYRYHPLLADALRARLAQEGAERVAELHGHAAAWHETAGRVEEAVFHALAGGHLSVAARLIETHCDALWTQGGQHTLEQWLKALPANEVAARPNLAVIQAAICLSYMQLSEAWTALDNCQAAAQETASWTPDIRGRMAVVRSHVMRFQGEFDSAIAFAREALASLSKDNGLWRSYALFSLGVVLYEADDLEEANTALTAAIAESREIGNAYTCMLASIVQGQLRHVQGALQEAARIYGAALAYAVERKYRHAMETKVLSAGLGRLYYEWNDLDAAEIHFCEGLKRSHPIYPLACYPDLFRLKQIRSDSEGVATLLRQLEEAAQQTGFPWLASVATAMKVRTKALGSAEAEAWIQEYETRVLGRQPARRPHGLRELEDLTWAGLRLGAGQAERVQARLEALLQTLDRQGCYGSAMEFRVRLAILYRRQGCPDQAVAILEPALTLAAREGYARVFLDAGPSLLPVLREAAAQGIEPDCVAGLLAAFRAAETFQADRSDAPPPLTEPLTAREVEVLRLLAAGLSNPDIAEHLFLSVGTVKRHVHHIFQKLEVTNRIHALARARELALL